MVKRLTKTKVITKKAFRDAYDWTPRPVVDTLLTKGHRMAEKRRVAIALNTARRKGAHIPRKK
jgi:hypothetical protein